MLLWCTVSDPANWSAGLALSGCMYVADHPDGTAGAAAQAISALFGWLKNTDKALLLLQQPAVDKIFCARLHISKSLDTGRGCRHVQQFCRRYTLASIFSVQMLLGNVIENLQSMTTDDMQCIAGEGRECVCCTYAPTAMLQAASYPIQL